MYMYLHTYPVIEKSVITRVKPMMIMNLFKHVYIYMYIYIYIYIYICVNIPIL
jgi:hypothetical protein